MIMDKLPIRSCHSKEMRNFSNSILHGVYLFLYGSVKYLSFPFFNYFRYGIIRLFSKNFKTTYVGDGVTIMFPWRVSVARTASLNRGTSIDGFGTVSIGEGVRIANNVSIYTADNDFSSTKEFIRDQGYRYGAVVIEDDVWIGGSVCINKGVRIGKSAVVGCGAVVTKDIPPYSVAAGVPCKVVKYRGEI